MISLKKTSCTLATAFIHSYIFWICDQIWWHCANEQPTTEAFLAYAESMRQIWLHQCKTYNFTLEKTHQMKSYSMSSKINYIYFPQFLFPLTYICRFLFFQLNKLFLHQVTGIFGFKWVRNNARSYDQCFFPYPKREIC